MKASWAGDKTPAHFFLRVVAAGSTFEREASARCVRNFDGELAVFQFSGIRGMRGRDSPAIESMGDEHLRFHFAGLARSKINGQLEIFFRILVKDDDRGLPVLELDSVGAGVLRRGLDLSGEVGGKKSAAAEQSGKLEAVGNGLQRVLRIEGRNGRIEGVGMGGDLLRSVAMFLSSASPGKAPPRPLATEGPVPPCRLMPV